MVSLTRRHRRPAHQERGEGRDTERRAGRSASVGDPGIGAGEGSRVLR
jgi:hypothetical protein